MSTEENPFRDFGEHPEESKEGETNFKGGPPLSPEEKEDIKRLASEGKGVNEIA